MSQKRDTDETFDLKLSAESLNNCKNLPTTTTTTTITTTSSGYGSVVHGHGPDSTRIDRGDQAQPRSDQVRSDPTQVTEERKRSATDTGSGGEAPKRAVNRCSGCRKRVGLTGFRCRCGDLFCAEHRYSDRHDCSYDYKSAGRVAIARENPVVRAAKILKV